MSGCVAGLRPASSDRVPEVGVVHSGGADVLDRPFDIGGAHGGVLQVVHRVAVAVLHRIPELVHFAGAGVLEPVEELVDPAHLVGVSVVALPVRRNSMSASRCFVPGGVRPNPPSRDAWM